jgi:hypothetical protein
MNQKKEFLLILLKIKLKIKEYFMTIYLKKFKKIVISLGGLLSVILIFK